MRPPDFLTAVEQKELDALVELQIDIWVEGKQPVTDESEDE